VVELNKGVEVLKGTSSLGNFDLDDPPAWRVFLTETGYFAESVGPIGFFSYFCNPVSSFWSSATF